MDAIELLDDLASRPLQALDYWWDDLDPAELNTHPGDHPNSPTWLLWHAAREIDVQLASLDRSYRPVWTSAGFDRRFGLDVAADDLGYGHSADQARAIRLPETEESKQLLRDHLTAVVEAARGYIASLTPAQLDEVVDPQWSPPVTRGVRLVSVFDDALQHVGQAGYAAGMTGVALG